VREAAETNELKTPNVRFISRDPVPHVNPYPYASNEPTAETDVSGAAGLPEETAELQIQTILSSDETSSSEELVGQAIGGLEEQGVQVVRAQYENLTAYVGAGAREEELRFVAQLNNAQRIGDALNPAQPSLPFVEGSRKLARAVLLLAAVASLDVAVEEFRTYVLEESAR
jgi:hypothetical protein